MSLQESIILLHRKRLNDATIARELNVSKSHICRERSKLGLEATCKAGRQPGQQPFWCSREEGIYPISSYVEDGVKCEVFPTMIAKGAFFWNEL